MFNQILTAGDDDRRADLRFKCAASGARSIFPGQAAAPSSINTPSKNRIAQRSQHPVQIALLHSNPTRQPVLETHEEAEIRLWCHLDDVPIHVVAPFTHTFPGPAHDLPGRIPPATVPSLCMASHSASISLAPGSTTKRIQFLLDPPSSTKRTQSAPVARLNKTNPIPSPQPPYPDRDTP